MIGATVVGAGGYVGAELVRLLEGHPEVDLVQVVSETYAGRAVASVLPNLRERVDLRFCRADDAVATDVVFTALPGGQLLRALPRYAALGSWLVDLSPDFRLQDPALRRAYYDDAPDPDEAAGFVPGLPELDRADLRGAKRVAVPGCMATAAILALAPGARTGCLQPDVIIDARTGSSGGGRRPSPASHHPERKGALRPYALQGHRHEAEIQARTGLRPQMMVTTTDAVRGVQVVTHARLRPGADPDALTVAYRRAYADEPFVRLLPGRGMYARPDPKILAGSNYCDISLDFVRGDRVVVISALDNLVKGAAGGAVQSLNVMAGAPERHGLEFAGLYPA